MAQMCQMPAGAVPEFAAGVVGYLDPVDGSLHYRYFNTEGLEAITFIGVLECMKNDVLHRGIASE